MNWTEEPGGCLKYWSADFSWIVFPKWNHFQIVSRQIQTLQFPSSPCPFSWELCTLHRHCMFSADIPWGQIYWCKTTLQHYVASSWSGKKKTLGLRSSKLETGENVLNRRKTTTNILDVNGQITVLVLEWRSMQKGFLELDLEFWLHRWEKI